MLRRLFGLFDSKKTDQARHRGASATQSLWSAFDGFAGHSSFTENATVDSVRGEFGGVHRFKRRYNTGLCQILVDIYTPELGGYEKLDEALAELLLFELRESYIKDASRIAAQVEEYNATQEVFEGYGLIQIVGRCTITIDDIFRARRGEMVLKCAWFDLPGAEKPNEHPVVTYRAAVSSSPAERKRHVAIIGILFDIDALGGGFYGRTAYGILFGSTDPNASAMSHCMTAT